MAQTKPKAAQFYGVSDNGTDGEFLQTDGTGAMAWASAITNPTITSIDYPGTATAANPAGGESVIINGTLFASGITCTVGGTTVTTVFNSATQITINTPAKSAGSYTVAVTNSNGGTASQANFIQYSGIPIWTTAAGNIGSVLEGAAASFQVTATEGSDTIEYAVTTGALPTGLSLATATGAITGTAGSVSADTTTTFSITATDDENQTSAVRSFNIIVTNDAPSNHFNTLIWTGNAVQGRAITTNNFQADFIWLKQRTNPGTRDPIIVDTVRGGIGTGPSATNFNLLYPYGTFAESTSVGNSYIPSIQNNGFTLGNSTYSNQSGAPTVAWSLKAGGAAVSNTDGTITSQVSVNNTLGFSIAKYAGNGYTGATYGHGLDATPELVLNKVLNYDQSWWAFTPTLGANKFMQLNTSAAATTDSDYYYSVSSSLFTLNGPGNPPALNQSGKNYITYNFTSKAGFSKVGTYTGNGSTKFIVTGFEVGFVMIKSTNASTGWSMYDSVRGGNKGLEANTAAAEFSNANNIISFHANGFSASSLNHENTNNNNYIYLAFAADGSTATPSLANSFATETYNGNGSNISITTGFKPDMVWMKAITVAYDPGLVDSVRGKNSMLLTSNTATGQTRADLIQSYNTNGYTWGSNNKGNAATNYVSWSWKARGITSINTTGTIQSLVSANQTAGFSIVKYDGATNATSDTSDNSGAYWSVGHELGGIPDLVIVKKINGPGAWYAGGAVLGSTGANGNHLVLSDTAAQGTEPNILWGGPQTFNSTTFGLGAWDIVNRNGDSYIAYCWKSITGYSKVGTYTGSTSNVSVTTGFQTTFVLVKNADTAGSNWTLWDSKRGGTNFLQPNNSGTQGSGRTVTFDSNGFTVYTNGGVNSNSNGDTFIYLAIKEN